MASYYSEHAQFVKRELAAEIDKDEIRKLHHIQAWKHFLIVIRQLLLLAGCVVLLVYFNQPWIWIPVAFALGFTIFNLQFSCMKLSTMPFLSPARKADCSTGLQDCFMPSRAASLRRNLRNGIWIITQNSDLKPTIRSAFICRQNKISAG